jgi:hypothetical protein
MHAWSSLLDRSGEGKQQLIKMEHRSANAKKMTRPGLEPGISGSGGRRLIH